MFELMDPMQFAFKADRGCGGWWSVEDATLTLLDKVLKSLRQGQNIHLCAFYGLPLPSILFSPIFSWDAYVP